MAVITLTTDFGERDHYLAIIKGAILCACPQAQFITISNEIEPFNIVQAAFLFNQTWPNFPAGTIHLLSVNDYYAKEVRFLMIEHQGHYFIGPDNGLFSLIFDPCPEQALALTNDLESTFPLKEIFAKTVGHIANKQPIDTLGKLVTNIQQRLTWQPVIGPAHIRGSVIYIDHYDNAVTNIQRHLFEQVGQNRAFKLFFKRHDPIKVLSKSYPDAQVGEPLCFFNSSGYLEIAINMGKAASLLGLQIEDTVQIDFKK
ncbi:MAG TPA: SAM-dependent chlorinase/fluorinase [Saprospiraceae bacterium]|nr:SAM-dependent chlorinase/fluorinase [Saprospiraceae bacterium]HMQ82505.1 SAM-dependent chlorinase/fluorinase [Saprospiraceae bacterium]